MELSNLFDGLPVDDVDSLNDTHLNANDSIVCGEVAPDRKILLCNIK